MGALLYCVAHPYLCFLRGGCDQPIGAIPMTWILGFGTRLDLYSAPPSMQFFPVLVTFPAHEIPSGLPGSFAYRLLSRPAAEWELRSCDSRRSRDGSRNKTRCGSQRRYSRGKDC